jgi:DNA-binding transcriptional LysR family regulator
MVRFTLHQLEIIKAIDKKKNFTKAASLVHLSQPSLSKQIKNLEKNFDLSFINRDHHEISFTEAGRIFLKYADKILELCEEISRIVDSLKNCEQGTFVVGASQTIGTYFMPKVLTVFIQKYPQINLKVEVDSTRLIAKMVSEKEIDLAVVGGEIPDNLKKNLQIIRLAQDDLVLIVGKSNTLDKKGIITKEDLYTLNFITLQSNSTIQKFMDTILIKNQIHPEQLKIVMELNSTAAIKTAVSLGFGVAFVSSSAIQEELDLKTLEIIQIKSLHLTKPISLISNKDSFKPKSFHYLSKSLLESSSFSERNHKMKLIV